MKSLIIINFVKKELPLGKDGFMHVCLFFCFIFFANPHSAQAAVDLTVGSLEVSGTLSDGNSFSFSGKVINNGPDSFTTSPSIVRFRLDQGRNGTWENTWSGLFIRGGGNTLTVGRSDTFGTATITSPSVSSQGIYRLEMCVDYDNALVETNEANNCALLDYSVGPPKSGLPGGQYSPSIATGPCSLSFTWSERPNVTEYVIRLDQTEVFRGTGIPDGNGNYTHTISGLNFQFYLAGFQEVNANGAAGEVLSRVRPNSCTTPTPTSTPIPSPLSTPTPTPPITFFTFTVFLHGIGKSGDSANEAAFSLSNNNPLTKTLPLNVTVFEDINGELIKTSEAIGSISYQSASGNFTGTVNMGTTLQSKTYLVKAKTAKNLRKIVGIPNVTPGATMKLPSVTLTAGDANNDNVLDMLDYNILYGCYSDTQPSRSCTSIQKVQSDFNDDGNVNQFDYNLFLRELGNRIGD